LKNPKQLIPVIILAVFWIGLGVLQALGIKPWPLKFLSFLTFAQGGLFGGFWGAVGGISVKAIFAYCVSALILPVFTGKASKKAIGEGFRRFTSGFKQFSLGMAAALLMGIGAALIVYNFLIRKLNPDQQHAGMVFRTGIRTMIRQTGFLWNLLLMIAGKLPRAGCRRRLPFIASSAASRPAAWQASVYLPCPGLIYRIWSVWYLSLWVSCSV
jgi:hypothetical protein